MLERIWRKGHILLLLMEAQTCTVTMQNKYGSFSENWKLIFLKTQSYHSWAQTEVHTHQTTTMTLVQRRL